MTVMSRCVPTPPHDLGFANGLRLAVLLIIPALATPAAATLVTTNFTGSVTSVPAALIADFSVGDPVTGTVTYDLSLAGPDQDASSTFGFYNGPAVTNFSATIGTYSVAYAGSLDISVYDDSTLLTFADRVSFRAHASSAPISGLTPSFIQHGYQSSDTTRLPDDAVPTAAELANFLPSEGQPSTNFVFFGGGHLLRWRVNSANTIAPVPEPTVAVLFTATAAAATIGRRRRA